MLIIKKRIKEKTERREFLNQESIVEKENAIFLGIQEAGTINETEMKEKARKKYQTKITSRGRK